MNGSATFSNSTLATTNSSLESEYNGSGWDTSTSNSTAGLSDTLSTSTGNGAYWRDVDGMPVQGTMNQSSSSRTLTQYSSDHGSENSVVTQDERHSSTQVDTTSTSMSTGGGSHSWAFQVGPVNVSGNESVLETSNDTSTSSSLDEEKVSGTFLVDWASFG
jgi:hypothetical protein